MTLVETIVLLILGCLVYWALAPIRRRIEMAIRRGLGRRGNGRDNVIDVTDYTKKKNKEP